MKQILIKTAIYWTILVGIIYMATSCTYKQHSCNTYDGTSFPKKVLVMRK